MLRLLTLLWQHLPWLSLASLNPVLYAYNTASIVNAGINVKEAVACAAPTYTNRNGKHSATNSRAKFGRAHIVAWAKEQHAQKLVELKAQHKKATGSKKAKLTKQIKAMELNLPTTKERYGKYRACTLIGYLA